MFCCKINWIARICSTLKFCPNYVYRICVAVKNLFQFAIEKLINNFINRCLFSWNIQYIYSVENFTVDFGLVREKLFKWFWVTRLCKTCYQVELDALPERERFFSSYCMRSSSQNISTGNLAILLFNHRCTLITSTLSPANK